jgi:tetratricopeptide (TPR) repeat protein
MHKKEYGLALQTIGAGLVVVGLVLTPLLVLPLSDQPIIDTKLLIPFLLAIVFLALFTIKSWSQNVISFIFSPLSIPLLMLGGGVLASSLFSGNYPVEHLLGSGGALLSLVLLASVGSSVLDKEKIEAWLPTTIAVAGGLLAISTIFQVFGFGPSHLINLIYPVAFPDNALFNLAGSSLLASQIFIIFLVGLASQFIDGKKTNLIEQIGVVVMVGGLLLAGWTMLPGKPAQPTLLPHTASWSISIDTLKSPKTALIGFGPEGFANAYNLHKPNWMNGSKVWNVQFNQASNTPFMLLVTTGLLGLSGWLLLVITVLRQTKHVTKRGKAVHHMLLASFVLQLFVPVTIVVTAIQALLLMAWISLESGRFSHIEIYGLTIRNIKSKLVAHPVTNNHKVVTYVFTALMVLSIGALTYGVGRAYAAHFYTVRSVAAAQRNDAITVYNTQQKAVALNPYLDETRRRYATTNLVVANALAQKTDRTEQENQQFAQLVQQSIREARAATLLDPLDTNNWTNLAQIYRSLVGVADSADQWAVDSYVSAIQTNPQNPILRVEIGGIFFRAADYNRAGQFFQQAIDLKPDYANAYYNLANAYKETGQLENAKITYQATLQLVQADSEDYFRATEELAAVEDLLKQQEATGQTSESLPPATEEQEEQPAAIPDTTSVQLESPLDTIGQPSAPIDLENVQADGLNTSQQPTQVQTQPAASASPSPTPAL